MEVKRNLQIQNVAANQRAASGTKNTNGSITPSPKNTSGRVVASKPQSEVNALRKKLPQGAGSNFPVDEEAGEVVTNKPIIGNLKSSNQSPITSTTIPNATGMKIATPKGKCFYLKIPLFDIFKMGENSMFAIFKTGNFYC